MASLPRALRFAQRASSARSTLQQSVRTPAIARRGYASAIARPATDDKSIVNVEQASEDLSGGNEDPNMNGNYPDPTLTSALPIKRQFRDPYADWWDPQERRNYGEVVHEDNDILGIFSPEEYTHFKAEWGGVLVGTFVATVLGLCAVVYQIHPDKPSAPRTFPGGLERELGGPRAPRAAISEDDEAAIIEGGSRSSRAF